MWRRIIGKVYLVLVNRNEKQGTPMIPPPPQQQLSIPTDMHTKKSQRKARDYN